MFRHQSRVITLRIFLEMTANFNIICNAITALVAPEQYDAGMAATQLIQVRPASL